MDETVTYLLQFCFLSTIKDPLQVCHDIFLYKKEKKNLTNVHASFKAFL